MMKRKVFGLEESFYKKDVVVHECCLCGGIIRAGERYYDGGFGRKAHVRCVMRVESPFISFFG
jgi:hypothetical protein